MKVPVYSWKNENARLALDISLAYHAGGVKVEEISSNVGLGWSLIAGGAITRTMRGIPDESANGFLMTPYLPDIATGAYQGQFVYASQPSSNITISSTNSSYLDLAANLNTENLDGQQDVFFYSFNGRSGKFFIGKDGSILIQNKDKLKIMPKEYSGNKLSAFEITDEDGKKYLFNATESTGSTYTTSNAEGESNKITDHYTSTWQLASIQSADLLHTISFTYGQFETQYYKAGYSEYRSINFNDDPLTEPYDQYQYRNQTTSYNTSQVFVNNLSRITFPDGIMVDFTYSANLRLDLEGSHALTNIVVSGGGKSFGYALTQGYFNNFGAYADYDEKRLRLDAVHRYSGTEQDKPWLFFYESSSLPRRDSKYQDYWGYPIGSSRSMMTLISKLMINDPGSGYHNEMNNFLDGADRTPDTVAVKTASLQKIVYPTGGYTVFEMESNDAYNEGSYFVKENTSPITFYKAQTNLDNPLNVSQATNDTISIKIQVVETSRAPFDPFSGYFEEDIDNNPVSFFISNQQQTWSTVVYSGTYGQARTTAGLNPITIVIPGQSSYFIKMQMTTQYPIDYTVLVNSSYVIEPEAKPVGGLRVKLVSNYEADGILISSKKYSYRNLDNKSSGTLSTVPNFDYYRTSQDRYYDCVMNMISGTLEMVSRNSESTQPLGSVQGSPIGYTRVVVEELNGSDASNGRIEYEFSPLQYFDYLTWYPFRAGEYISWGAGLLKKEYTYNAQNKLLRAIDNNYQVVINKSSQVAHRSLKSALVFSDNCNTAFRRQFVVSESYPVLGYTLKQNESIRECNDSDTISISTSYVYDPVYLQEIERNTQTSTGIQQIKLYYPYHYSGIVEFQNLTMANRISTPVKQEIWQTVNGLTTLKAATATSYQDFGGFIRPHKMYSLKTERPLTQAEVVFSDGSLLTPLASYGEDVAFEAYAANGAPIGIRRPNGPLVSYFWTRDGGRLLAEVKYANSFGTYFEDFEQIGNTVVSRTGSKGYSGNYTPPFAPPSGSQYLISYWIFDGSQWNYSGELPYSGASISGVIDDVRVYPNLAHVETFTHQLLEGITSHTDAKGMTVYYEYDSFQRLKHIKDQNGNIIKSYNYNYRP